MRLSEVIRVGSESDRIGALVGEEERARSVLTQAARKGQARTKREVTGQSASQGEHSHQSLATLAP